MPLTDDRDRAMARHAAALVALTAPPQLVFSDRNAAVEPVEFLLEPFLPRGRLVSLVAPGGTGKGTVWRNWTAALTRGWDALTNDRVAVREPASVLIVSFEESWAGDILPGLLAEGADLTRVHHLAGVKVAGVREDFALRDVDLLVAELAKADDKPALVIFDPASELLGSAGVNPGNDPEIRRGLIRPVRKLAEATGATVLLVMHFNKDRSQTLQGRTAGSAGLVNAVRMQVSMIRHPDDKTVGVVGVSKQNVGREATRTYRVRRLTLAEVAAIRSRTPSLRGPEGEARWAKLEAQLGVVHWDDESPESIDELYQRQGSAPAPTFADDEAEIRAWVLARPDGTLPGELRTGCRAARRRLTDAKDAEMFLDRMVADALGLWEQPAGKGKRFVPRRVGSAGE